MSERENLTGIVLSLNELVAATSSKPTLNQLLSMALIEASECLVRAGFAQLAFVHYQNAVGALNRGQPVRDHNRGSSFHHAIQCLPDTQLGFRVDIGSCFIGNFFG